MVLVRAVHAQVSKEAGSAEVPLTEIYCQEHGRSHEEDARHIVYVYKQYGTTALAGPVFSITVTGKS
jgi:hypothetical protein